MAQQSYVNTVATSALNRRNSRIDLDDKLKTTASQRTLQDRQGRASLSQAAASNRNASANMANARTNAVNADTSRQQMLASAALQAGELDLRSQVANQEMAINQQELGQRDRQIAIVESMLPHEIEQIKSGTEANKLEYADSLLKYELNKAMQSGKKERIGKLFALEDAMISSKTHGYRAEQSLAKWASIGRFATGIKDSLSDGRIDMAESLRNQLVSELPEEIAQTIPLLSQPASLETLDQWELMADVGLNAVDFQQQMLLNNAKNGTSHLNTVLDLIKFNLDREDKAINTNMKINDNFLDRVAPTLAQMLDLNAQPGGTVDEGGETATAWNSYLSNVMSMLTDSDGNIKVPEQEARSRATKLTQEMQVANAAGIRGGFDTFIVPRLPTLPNENNNGPLFSDTKFQSGAEQELGAVMNDDTYRKFISGPDGALSRLAATQNDPRVSTIIEETRKRMDSARDSYQRAEIYAELTRILTALKLGIL